MGASDFLSGSGRSECALDSAGGVPRVQSDGGGGTIGPGSGEGKPHGRCRDLGKRGCALGLAAADPAPADTA